MVHIDQELIQDFIVESQEGLAQVENQMLAIEARGNDIQPDLVNGVFRTMHSIKGTAGFMGLDVIGLLAHSLEEILDDMRNRELCPTSQIVSTVLKASDVMQQLIDAIETSNEFNVQPLIDELAAVRNSAKSQTPASNHDQPATHPKADRVESSTTYPSLDDIPIASDTARNQPSIQAAANTRPTTRLPDSDSAVGSSVSSSPAPVQIAAPASQPTHTPSPASLPATSASPSSVRAEAITEFVAQCRENLDQMDEDLIALDNDLESTGLQRSLFRTMHTIKGGAGMLGAHRLERFAHATEEILVEVRDGKRKLSQELIGILLECVERCREALHRIEFTRSDDGFDPSCTLMALERIKHEHATDSTPRSTAPAFDRPTFTEPAGASSLQAPTPPGSPRNAIHSPGPATPSTAAPVARPVEEPKDAASASSDALTRTSSTAGESTIRVDVALLDKLMTRVGELVLARNQILQRASSSDDSTFTSTAQRLNLITTELQESVMKTRMQPIGNVWSKFPRVVRDLATQLKKLVRIEMEGKETELDKTIIEAIKDPLTHIVRNSVDHGLELPETRRACGKNAEGLVLLRAYHEGGQVVIEIVDDGKGLDIERIRRKAVERGMITSDQASRMSDRDATQLILLPGFSTAEQVTNISGRGVGMDVVKTNIERIGGTLDIKSEFGKGTLVKIKIPLTLAIIPALIVTSDNDRFAIPQVSLLELVRLEGEQADKSIEFLNGAPVYRLRGKLLPLVSLSDRLGLPNKLSESEFRRRCQASDSDRNLLSDDVFNIVVLRANETHFGLIVDKVNDTEEIVVKPLSPQLKCLQEYAGATIMGDGKVALILDVMGLAVSAGLVGSLHDSNRNASNRETNAEAKPTQTLLLVEEASGRRFALPTSMVSRLETAALTAIEHADGREVMQYRDDILPLIRLSEPIHTASGTESEGEFKVVVYKDQSQSCGFVVHRIVDIIETQLELPEDARPQSDLLGTTVLQNRVTDVLDLRKLARTRGAVSSLN